MTSCSSWPDSGCRFRNADRPRDGPKEGGTHEMGVIAGPIAAGILAALALILLGGIHVVREYARAVVLRLGRLVAQRGPGLIYVIPVVEKMMRVDIRTAP